MDIYEELWDKVLEYCKDNTTDTAYSLWFKPIKIKEFTGTEVVIEFTNEFFKRTVVKMYDNLIREAFKEICGFEIDVSYYCPEDEMSKSEKNEINLEDFRNETFTFDNFIVGPSNRFAHAAAKAVAADPAGQISCVSPIFYTYNPLFIYGPSGLGKTHLLNAISYEVAKNYPEMKITYVKAENFANEFIASLGKKTVDEFHDKYRNNIDLFLVDDIQFIAGKTQTEEEFFHTFNSLVDNGKQIVLTADRPPKEIKSLTERLCSRFESGLLADIQPPEFETRCAIIKRKAQLLNFDLSKSDNVVEYIAQNIKSNIRQLEGITKKLQALCRFSEQVPTIALAQAAIKDVQNYSKPIKDVIDEIVGEVSRTTGVSVEDINSKKQTNAVSVARKMTFYIIREVTDMSYKSIGEKFGRDHSTVMYNIRDFGKTLQKNPALNNQTMDIINNLKDN